MLGKQSGIYSSDSKSSEEDSGVTFDSNKYGFKGDNTDLEGSEFSVSNSFLGDRRVPVYNQSLSYPIGDVSHSGNSLNLFENTSTDLLCDDFPEIGSFEDIDRMFSKEEGFGWLSSAYVKGVSREAMQSDFGFQCHETSMGATVSECQCFPKTYTEWSEVPFSIKAGPCTQEKSCSYTYPVNGVGIYDGKYASTPEEQVNGCKRQLKQLEAVEEKRNDNNFGNESNRYLGNLPYEPNQLSSGAISLKVYPTAHVCQQPQATEPDSFCYLQNNGSQSYSVNSQLSDLDSVTFTDSTSLSPWVSSPPPNQMQFIGNSHDPQSLSAALSATDNGVEIHTFQSNVTTQSRSLMDQTSIMDPELVGDQVIFCGEKFENPTDAGGVTSVIPAEPGSLLESSMMNMNADDISAIFCQLQLVMEWLDLRTKLCIRDGLYRLARNAEQRLNNANLCGDSRGGSFTAEETNNCTSLLNMETSTNPIDRSIAELLFHRPSDSSVISTHDV